ncbi:hypothetical protein [Actinomadura meridiana]|uniref:hypothetical protein n=1 Tax=Actinomadura meridiana TaxID=559626 RepID=UPI0031E8EC74
MPDNEPFHADAVPNDSFSGAIFGGTSSSTEVPNGPTHHLGPPGPDHVDHAKHVVDHSNRVERVKRVERARTQRGGAEHGHDTVQHAPWA